jgi:beta-phosphoglucomutase-like phosphatase (HAD superfamily)
MDADVCGRDLPHGKPDPLIFQVAARELGLPPAACFVVEDAPVGVLAARRAGMAAVGVARQRDSAWLIAAGANLVVTSLDQVSIPALLAGRLERLAPAVAA